MFCRALLALALVACGKTPPDAPASDAASVPTAATPAQPAPASADIPEVVAEIGGKPVTWNEVFDVAASELIQAEVELSDTRREAVEGYVMQKLLEAEAAKTGSTPEQLVRNEVTAKMTPVTDAEIEAFYKENQAQMQGTLEQMKPQIAQYLEQERGTTVIRDLLERLKAENNVKLMMPRYRVQVEAGNAPRKGPATAPVQIVEFSDFQCPYCGDAAETVRQIEQKYGDKVSVVYRNFPLPMHPQAHRAAEAALCAHDQGGFWKYHDALFADRKAWTDEDFEGYAKQVGLDPKALGKCLDDGTHVATVDKDIEDGRRAGMSGTPGFYVNGIVLSGAQPLEAFEDVIDAELARAAQ